MPLLSQVNERDSLTPRRDPYWFKLSKGCYLGFRKMTAGTDGTWLARFMDEALGKQQYKALGDFSELGNSKRHDAAKKQAEAWFTHLGKGGSPESITVLTACENYIDHIKQAKGEASKAARDLEGRFKAYVYNQPRLTRLELPKLTPAHLKAWRKALRSKPTDSGPRRGQQRSDSSLNRDMTCLRAALNMAYKDGHVTSDFAWRGKLRPIKSADNRRTDYLDTTQRRKLVNNAPADLADFLRGLVTRTPAPRSAGSTDGGRL